MSMDLPPSIFEVGQVYSCDSAKPERQLEVTVGRIDELQRRARIISVSIADHGRNPSLADIGHAPFDEKVLSASCRTLVKTSVRITPDFEEGYRAWRTAFDSNSGGHYTISVDHVLDLAIQMLAQQRPMP